MFGREPQTSLETVPVVPLLHVDLLGIGHRASSWTGSPSLNRREKREEESADTTSRGVAGQFRANFCRSRRLSRRHAVV